MTREARSTDPRRRSAREAARRLADDGELRRARRYLAGESGDEEAGRVGELLDALGIQPLASSESEASTPPAAAGPRSISIWQPQGEGAELCWVRPQPHPLGDHYAARRVLRPRAPASAPKVPKVPGTSPAPKVPGTAPSPKVSGTFPKVPGTPSRRLCFFGESVAAGYLYAPQLTPAQVLEEQLREVEGPDVWEVIDLARTNERLTTLVETVEASRQLEPDLLVVFAGNNWTLLETPELSPYAPSLEARRRLAGALQQGGATGLARLARRELAGRAMRAMARLAEAAAGRPLVLVIPEVSRADWETAQPVTWLSGAATERWHRLLQRVREALEAGTFAAAESIAWEMVELDGGLCPTPFRLLAAALAAQGRDAAARDAAASEVDSLHYPLMACLAAPQAGVVARRVLTEAARQYGFRSVDLAQVFADWNGSPLPGRELFLDYCHLTVEGMKVAMAAVTAEVLHLTGSRCRDSGWRALAERLPDPAVTPEAEAVARLGAAVHTAHRLLPVTAVKGELLRFWCRESLAASPGVAAALLDLAAARAAPAPALLTAALRRNQESPYPLLLQHGWSWDGLDGSLLEALMAVLDEVGAEADGRPAAEVVRQALLEGRGLTAQGLELAVPAFFHAEPVARFYPEVMPLRDLPGRATYRSPWPESAFHLVTAAQRPLNLRLTARLPAVEGWPHRREGEVSVAVGGAAVGRAKLSEGWGRHRFSVPRALLKAGINRVVLGWPPPPPAGEKALEAAIRRLEEGREAELHPVFGEVCSLRAEPS